MLARATLIWQDSITLKDSAPKRVRPTQSYSTLSGAMEAFPREIRTAKVTLNKQPSTRLLGRLGWVDPGWDEFIHLRLGACSSPPRFTAQIGNSSHHS